MIIEEGLTFDDVLLKPKFSEIKSRSEVNVSVKMGKFKFNHPVIPANMKTISGMEMVLEIAKSGGLGVLHRFMSLEEQVNISQDIVDEFGLANNFAVSIGVKEEDKKAVEKFVEVGVKIICIDIAHGDSEQCLQMINWINKSYPSLFVIAGNVATADGAERLWLAGADVVKVGIGPGSLCTTRVETGNGVPQLTALMEVYKKREEFDRFRTLYDHKKLYIIADGGIKNSGDIVKALCFSDMVMVGNLFAGCDETPGNIINIDGRQYKEYVGSSTHKSNHIEGVAALVHSKGPMQNILNKLLEGLKSGCSYQGVKDLNRLKDNPIFIKMSGAGLRESHPHDVIVK